jgi:hypothetical protein
LVLALRLVTTFAPGRVFATLGSTQPSCRTRYLSRFATPFETDEVKESKRRARDNRDHDADWLQLPGASSRQPPWLSRGAQGASAEVDTDTRAGRELFSRGPPKRDFQNTFSRFTSYQRFVPSRMYATVSRLARLTATPPNPTRQVLVVMRDSGLHASAKKVLEEIGYKGARRPHTAPIRAMASRKQRTLSQSPFEADYYSKDVVG